MDLRDPLPPQHQLHHQHPQTPPGMMSGPPQNSYNSPSMPTTTTMNPNSPMLQSPRFPFNSGPPKPMESINQQYGDGPHLVPPQQPPSGFGIESGKKKRGRPRKYSPDSNIALGLAPSPSTVTPVTGASPLAVVGGHGDSGGGPMSSDPSQAKRSRGRPPGSGKKQLDALGSFGVSFTPHVILVKAGEDIASKIMDFSRQGPRTVCILSANGAVSNITLRQPAMSGGNVTYEGRFEIISLSGSFFLSESNGNRSRTGGLSVSLAGSDGRVLGGGVAGMLVAATPVQVIVGSFIADGKKSKSGPSSAPMSTNVLNVTEPVAAESPPSQGHSSESSDENGGSPFNRVPGPYNHASQPVHNAMPMYSNMGWGN